MPATPNDISPPAASAETPRPWHSLTVDECLAVLGTDPLTGLSPDEALARHAAWGPNILAETSRTRWYSVLLRQFVGVLIAILIIAAVIAFLIGEPGDAATILVIVVLNGALGFAQEWRAEKAIEALRRMLQPRCRVLRGGEESEMDSSALVPGDIVLIVTGDRVAADLRVLESVNLKVDESSLTGESVSVAKGIEPTHREAPLAERGSVLWMGTAVTNGRGRGVVTETGMRTEFGRIAGLTQTVGKERSQLEVKLDYLAKQLGVLALLVSALVVVAGLVAGKGLTEMFLTGVSLAVAVVPEGLPAVLTISLALGVRAMARRKALARRLRVAETLGAATVICTDKTGTLTENQMTVTRIWHPGGVCEVTGSGYDPAGEIKGAGAGGPGGGLREMLETAVLCNHARVERENGGWKAVGEPTEAALVVVAGKGGVDGAPPGDTLAEFSFSSARKRMTVVKDGPRGPVAHVKGAPEVILGLSTRVLSDAGVEVLGPGLREEAARAYEGFAAGGLRTLAIARRVLEPGVGLSESEVERDLVLLGIVGMVDPPRPEVPGALRLTRSAGIRVVMITGDAPATALAIARDVGLDAHTALTGVDIDSMDDTALREALGGDVLFARTAPEHKLRIVELLQQRGEVVAMTGDGVNDAPALKKADIGIAMGIRGTEVAKDAADMVLADDNLSTIVSAVEQGRKQYENIQKFVGYLLSSNIGEIVAITLNIVLGGPLILLPVQILWMNLVTDGTTALALALEPAERGVMAKRPRGMDEPILDRRRLLVTLLLGTYIGLVTLWLYQHYLDGDPARAIMAQTVAFTGIILLEKFNVFNFRTLSAPLHTVGLFTNPWLLVAWAGNIGLQICAVYTPFMQEALHTAPLGLREWALIGAVALPVFLIAEGVKLVRWKRRGGGGQAPCHVDIPSR